MKTELKGLDADKALYVRANKLYNEGGKPIMTDTEFDKLERGIRKADPDWKELRKTGAAVGKKVEVRLPAPMPSLAKVYPEDQAKWLAKQKVKRVLSMHKLDGSALQAKYSEGRCVFLATRGDGEFGKDISFLIPHLNLPKVKEKTDFLLRIEAVMKEATFKKKWLRKDADDKDGFENARNMVNGLLNRTKVHKGMADIDMVVLGVYDYAMLAGLDWADHMGFITVERKIQKVDADWETVLAASRKLSDYAIDGLVRVAPEHRFEYLNFERPKWVSAFKVNDDADAVKATVVDIIWQMSRTGRWTPKIKIKPTTMKGVVVTYATAHNAQWITERKIGIGAVIKVVRSGDVIPKIVGVVKPAAQPSHPPGEFYEKGVHYYATTRHKDADVREILHFFTVLGIENIARKGVEKLYDGSFTSVLHHLEAFNDKTKHRGKIELPGLKSYTTMTTGMLSYQKAGMGLAMSAKIFMDAHRILEEEGVTLLKLMNASNCFESFGERKLALIQNHYMAKGDSNPLKGYVKRTQEWLMNEKNWSDVKTIKGMGEASAQQFFEGVQRFKLWFHPILKTRLLKINEPDALVKKKAVVGLLTGQRVSFTGYRNTDHEAAVEVLGAEIVPFGSKTTILLYKKGGKASTKLDKARGAGARVCTFEELK